jgi:hypothetical protein
MRRTKARKIELGKNKPSEVAATNAIVHDKTSVWMQRLNDCRENTEAEAILLVDLFEQIKSGKVEREIFNQLTRIRPMRLSIERAVEIMKSKELRNGSKKATN